MFKRSLMKDLSQQLLSFWMFLISDRQHQRSHLMYFSLIVDSKSKPTLIKLVFIFCSLFCCLQHHKCGCKVLWIIRLKESKKMRGISLGSFKRYNRHLTVSQQANKICLVYCSSIVLNLFSQRISGLQEQQIQSGKALMTVCVLSPKGTESS